MHHALECSFTVPNTSTKPNSFGTKLSAVTQTPKPSLDILPTSLHSVNSDLGKIQFRGNKVFSYDSFQFKVEPTVSSQAQTTLAQTVEGGSQTNPTNANLSTSKTQVFKYIMVLDLYIN